MRKAWCREELDQSRKFKGLESDMGESRKGGMMKVMCECSEVRPHFYKIAGDAEEREERV